jgi:DNA excision repair protein ERCC-5
LNLVDGIITDDADVFLFGGRNVFKNIFSDKKYLEWYMMDTIESELMLKRGDLINLALLLGSDYTEGVRGVGPVNAYEILRAFGGDLAEFRTWMYTPASQYDFSRGTDGNEADIEFRRDFSKRHANVRKSWEVR